MNTVVVFFKWTCEYCGQVQIFGKPNTLFPYGECYVCGKTTKIKSKLLESKK